MMPRILQLNGFLCLFFAGVVSAKEPVDFKSQVQPIFADRCLHCHGADGAEGNFRIDRLASLRRGGDSGSAAVVPGNPAASFLLDVLRHQEPGYEMPPDEDRLTESEIALIERWIRQGAPTPESYGPAEETVELSHWAFQPIRRPESTEGIDDLIRRQLGEKGLDASPQADRRTLIRRLFLVMLGLPPTPERVEAFVKDQRPNAWQLLVEDVLASPHYGERLATHWLDLVRFGETHGFETNRERPHAWRYRDWVVQAFNEDMPYDTFVRQQIAGDAFGEDTATGFLVAGPFDQVRGKDPKLRLIQRTNELDDMINTTGTAFLGLTTGCARCHNHKFDPITQVDYYALQGVFAGVQHGDRALPISAAKRQQIADLDTEIDSLTKKLRTLVTPKADASIAIDDRKVADRPPVNSKHNTETFSPRKARFVRFMIEKTNRGEACIDELEIFSGATNVALASRGAKATSSGDFVHPKHRLEHINDGRYGNARSWIAKDRTNAWVQIELAEPAVVDRIEWGRDREGQYDDRLATGYRIDVAEEPGHWHRVAESSDRAPADDGADPPERYRFDDLSAAQAATGKRWLKRLGQVEQRKEDLQQATLVYAGKFEQPGPTHRLHRGEPEQPREQVAPGGISVFDRLELAIDAPEQRRRMALARWITQPDNPLTARVLVNRLWQFHFGTGIVDTPSDFGRNGATPTHPQLIDWLACELIENGWSIKHVHRCILQSATWKQDNKPRIHAMRVDAASRLLWRFPPRRLEAEGIRDSILTATGVLNLQVGGRGFSAFQVEAENVRHYHPKSEYGPEDWRRMLYMTKVRQEKDVVFGAFDCPDASQAVPKRSRSTTPLQALNLLNSRFVMQQAERFVARLNRDAQRDEERIERAWQLCFQRPPRQEEVDEAARFIEQQGWIQFARAMLNTNEFIFIP